MIQNWLQRLCEIFRGPAQDEPEPESTLPAHFNDIHEIRHDFAVPARAERDPSFMRHGIVGERENVLSAVLDHMRIQASRRNQDQPWSLKVEIIGEIRISTRDTGNYGIGGAAFNSKINN